MKRLLNQARSLKGLRGFILASTLFGLASAASAQGRVVLANDLTTLVTNAIPGHPEWPPVGSLLFELVTAPVGTTDLRLFKPTGVLATNVSSPGRVSGAVVAVAGWPPGETRAFAIVGWSASLGTNLNPAWFWQGCLNGFGASSIGFGSPGVIVPFRPFQALNAGFVLSGPLSPELCPWIITPPVSQRAGYGSSVTFTVFAVSGPQPLTYQWQFNGTNLPGVTSSALVLTNVQTPQAGAYAVTVFNGLSPVSSSLAMLVLGIPLTIATPPQSQTAELGASVRFGVGATGDPPLVYRWFLNATNAINDSTTNSFLELADVQSTKAGAYTVVITNVAGSVTSAPAMLSVIPPIPRRIVPALILLGQPGMSFNLQDADVLAPLPNWATLDNLALTNTAQWYFDLSTSLPPQRFYRTWATNGPSPPPALYLHIVPAVTLTGTVGNSLRLDYINKLGPTDAWFTLDVLTLTGTSQLYVDVSAIGQPPRLWRIVPVP